MNKCPYCGRYLVSEENLYILRKRIFIAMGLSGLGGVLMLPMLGFGLGGITAGSVASAWQSSIGSVAAGSLFAALQSLGMTGLGSLLFGSIGAALPLLALLAPKINFCNRDCKHYTKSVSKQ